MILFLRSIFSRRIIRIVDVLRPQYLLTFMLQPLDRLLFPFLSLLICEAVSHILFCLWGIHVICLLLKSEIWILEYLVFCYLPLLLYESLAVFVLIKVFGTLVLVVCWNLRLLDVFLVITFLMVVQIQIYVCPIFGNKFSCFSECYRLMFALLLVEICSKLLSKRMLLPRLSIQTTEQLRSQ